jgi:hypothetical protein
LEQIDLYFSICGALHAVFPVPIAS